MTHLLMSCKLTRVFNAESSIRVPEVKAEYPNQLDYNEIQLINFVQV